MLIRVYVTPNAREARVVKVSDDYLKSGSMRWLWAAERIRDFWRF